MEPLLRDPVADEEAFRAALHGYFRHSTLFFYQNRALFHLLVREAWRLQLSVEEDHRDYLRVQIDRSVAMLGEVVERAIAAGAIRPLPVRTFAHFLLIGTINHVASEKVTGWPENPTAAADEAATFLTGLFMDGAKPGP
jgi:AcrR family transcriptional regulator